MGLDPVSPRSCPGPKAALNRWATRGLPTLCLLTGTFRLFTFKLIINSYVFIAIF
ncbi:unnamed protein product [Nyctereutes procyonoides]|uniref:(raccoon dog) hypothetical protein n=1 Tax=Nyctereutes procyonoides TaxID=34880 RepID=A0A811YW93_NYCPR|nr:unnamed protein product [Nyctereutes procyonoides]